jgi:hypothetical protein
LHAARLADRVGEAEQRKHRAATSTGVTKIACGSPVGVVWVVDSRSSGTTST